MSVELIDDKNSLMSSQKIKWIVSPRSTTSYFIRSNTMETAINTPALKKR